MGFGGAGYSATEFADGTDFTAVASSATEATLLAGRNLQPYIPAGMLGNPQNVNRSFKLKAWGVISCTGTPTMTFTARMSATQGSSTITGAILGISPAMTLASGIATKMWFLELYIHTKVVGQGATNATVNAHGIVWGPAGGASAGAFAALAYALTPTAPDTATWTQTYDGAVTQYINLCGTWSASNAANTITCKHLEFDSLN